MIAQDLPPAKKPPRVSLDQNGQIVHMEDEEDEPTDSKGDDGPAMFSRAETAPSPSLSLFLDLSRFNRIA